MKHNLLIIIVTYNCCDVISACLENIRAQNFSEYHVLIVDNASVDGTVQRISEFTARYPDIKNKVEVKRNLENKGFARAVNVGLKQVSSDPSITAVLLLNPDAGIDTMLLSRGTEVLSQARVGACSPLIVYPDGRTWWCGTRVFSQQEILTRLHHGVSEHISKGKNIADKQSKEQEVEALTGCSMFISAQAVRETGLFDESYFMYAEDLDYSLRLTSGGYKLKLFNDVPVVHYVHDRKLGIKDRLYGLRKYKIYLTSVGVFIRRHYRWYVFPVWCFKLPFALLFSYYRTHDEN